MLGFNYPLQDSADISFAKSFYEEAQKNHKNLYYYPKPNRYKEIDDFAFFSLRNCMTPENFKIEMLYRNGLIQRDLRGVLHTLLRREKGIDEKIYKKKFFYESRKLFNISYKWSEYAVSKEHLLRDLIDKMEVFYPYPSAVNVTITNICNLECVMCPLHSKTLKPLQKTDFIKTKRFLDDAVVYSVVDFVSESSQVSTIGFTAAGEATLDKRLPKFISYAREKGIPFVYLVTNGTLLEEKGEALLQAGLNRMTISIDGATPETYKKIRGTDLHKVEGGVRKCVELARKMNAQGANIEFDLTCVLTDVFVDSKEEEMYLKKWEDCRDVITRIVFKRLLINDAEGRDINSVEISNEKSQSLACSLPWDTFNVDPSGNVQVCCTTMNSVLFNDLYSIGNILNEGCKAVWNSEKAKKLRMENLLMRFSEFPICDCCAEKFKICYDVDVNTTTQTKMV